MAKQGFDQRAAALAMAIILVRPALRPCPPDAQERYTDSESVEVAAPGRLSPPLVMSSFTLDSVP